jgi:hypothetical protein
LDRFSIQDNISGLVGVYEAALGAPADLVA